MYIGRFAPSPTGPLHFGSLVAATASYLESRVHNGRWLVRMEDLDPPREQAGAAQDILHTLEAFGFRWDGDVMFQSRHHTAYEQALEKLAQSGMLYPCTCSRRELVEQSGNNAFGTIYPGTCRSPANRDGNKIAALRLRTSNTVIQFNDGIQGSYAQQLETDIGDFILKRRDGYYAYHLAVVVDDADQDITHIVRGADLLDSTPRQIYLQQLLNLHTPVYMHLPIAVNKRQQKLSKQTRARALDIKQAPLLLCQALDFLGQQPDLKLAHEPLNTVWQWALDNWQSDKIPRVTDIVLNVR